MSWVLQVPKVTAFLGPKMMVALEKVASGFEYGHFLGIYVKFLGLCDLEVADLAMVRFENL